MISRELFPFLCTIRQTHCEIGVRYPSVVLTGGHIRGTIPRKLLLWHWFPAFGGGSPVAIRSNDRLRSGKKFRSASQDRLTWLQKVSQLWSGYKAPLDEKGVEQCILDNSRLAERCRFSSRANNTTGSHSSESSQRHSVGYGGSRGPVFWLLSGRQSCCGS